MNNNDYPNDFPEFRIINSFTLEVTPTAQCRVAVNLWVILWFVDRLLEGETAVGLANFCVLTPKTVHYPEPI